MANPMQGTERLEAVRVREKLGDALIKVKEFRDDTFLCVKRESIVDVISLLKNDPDLDYGYFSECLGADYSAWHHERDLTERF